MQDHEVNQRRRSSAEESSEKGARYLRDGKYPLAIQKLNISINIFSQLQNKSDHDKYRIAHCYYLLGVLYEKPDDLFLALEYYQKAVLTLQSVTQWTQDEFDLLSTYQWHVYSIQQQLHEASQSNNFSLRL